MSNLSFFHAALHHRCIERIYGDHGADILEQLRRDPKATAPVLVVRIKEKLAEWFICRPGMLKVFKATHLRNDLKARDHRGKQFKVDDLKTISSKGAAESNQLTLTFLLPYNFFLVGYSPQL